MHFQPWDGGDDDEDDDDEDGGGSVVAVAGSQLSYGEVHDDDDDWLEAWRRDVWPTRRGRGAAVVRARRAVGRCRTSTTAWPTGTSTATPTTRPLTTRRFAEYWSAPWETSP